MQYFGITENGLESFFEVTKLIFGLPQKNDIRVVIFKNPGVLSLTSSSEQLEEFRRCVWFV